MFLSSSRQQIISKSNLIQNFHFTSLILTKISDVKLHFISLKLLYITRDIKCYFTIMEFYFTSLKFTLQSFFLLYNHSKSVSEKNENFESNYKFPVGKRLNGSRKTWISTRCIRQAVCNSLKSKFFVTHKVLFYQKGIYS